MRFYEKQFENNFEELITYYPRFYRDVYEMVEILKANGRVFDRMEGDIEQTYLNCFIEYADEETIKKLEDFLDIRLNRAGRLRSAGGSLSLILLASEKSPPPCSRK